MWSGHVFSKCYLPKQSIIRIIAGCTNPLMTSMILEIIIKPSNPFNGSVGGGSLQQQFWLQPIHAHVDSVTPAAS